MRNILPSIHIDGTQIDIRAEVSEHFQKLLLEQIDRDVLKFWTPSKKKVSVGPGIDENGIPVDNLIKEVDEPTTIRFMDYQDIISPHQHWNHTYWNPLEEE